VGEGHVYIVAEGKPGGNRRRWEDNIKMALQAMRWWGRVDLSGFG
jgi:hypothetical protein